MLLRPWKWPGAANPGARSATRAQRHPLSANARGTERAPCREPRPLPRAKATRSRRITRLLAGTNVDVQEADTRESLSSHNPSGRHSSSDYLPHLRAARAAMTQDAFSSLAPRRRARAQVWGRSAASGSAAAGRVHASAQRRAVRGAAAELDGSGTLTAQYVYGSNPNVPDYIVKGGVQYRVPLSVCLNVYRLAFRNCMENGGRGNFY